MLIFFFIPRSASLFGVESLQQYPQLLKAQFEFLGHLRPCRLRDVGKVERYVLVLEICECPLEGGKHLPRVALFQRQVSYDLERGFESNSVVAVRLDQAIGGRVGCLPKLQARAQAGLP
jgi:hypothetical protein